MSFLPINFFQFCQPGLYKIICTKNNKVYIGQSSNCLYRIGGHVVYLKNQTHHCCSLLADFNKYGLNAFKAFMIDFGEKYQNQSIRKKEETRLISKTCKKFIYNFYEYEIPAYKSYKYKNQIFQTIKDLRLYINQAENQNYSETHFRRCFISPFGKYNDQRELVKTYSQSDVFIIHNKIYNGWQEVVQNKLAKNKRQVFYRLNSAAWPDYKYFRKTKKRVGFQKRKTKYEVNKQIFLTAKAIVEHGLAENTLQVYY